ncbi:MAG TPA: hypothetical protein P5121_37870 [Caldilineaceae bacterium]|nr:hypothetical protein [Caldilineaceae bacterium]
MVLLQIDSLDVETGLLDLERPNIDVHQIHQLSPDTLRAYNAYVEAGGWSSLEMPRHYVERAQIANIGMTD